MNVFIYYFYRLLAFGSRLYASPSVALQVRVATLACLAVLLYVPALQVSKAAIAAPAPAVVPVIEAKAPVPAVAPVVSPPAPVPTPAVVQTAVVPAAPSCRPNTTFGLPSQIQLGQEGLAEIVDAPTYYQVYGYSVAEIRSQLQRCAPKLAVGSGGGEYAAQTSYRLNWRYETVQNGQTCSIAGVAVGIHIAVILPSWQASPYANPEVANSWRSFAQSLTAHENTHVELNRQHARTMLAGMRSIGPMDCAVFGATVDAIIQSHVNALNHANERYDERTNHGAHEGAEL
jgi:predicted secreted Zn-dependent protease